MKWVDHEHIPMGEKPEWWRANERLRREFDLPGYEPPRFSDGTYTHEVVPDLEAVLGVELQFVGVDARHGDDWTVRADGEPLFSVGRRRDRRGNTVWQLSAEAFEQKVREQVKEAASAPDSPEADQDATG